MLSVKQRGIKYYFWVFGMTRPGIELLYPGPLANTLLIKLMAQTSVEHDIFSKLSSPAEILSKE